MARRARIVYEGAIYHAIFRGNARESIFRDDRDRERCREALAERVETYGVRLYLYVFMRNHVHLLLETPGANLPAFMGSLQTSYATYFNLRHSRVGHLTQGRYKSPLVEGNAYLLRLSRYIHLNPVCVKPLLSRPLAERVTALRQYRWSSYRAYAGLCEPEDGVTYGPLQALTPGRKGSSATTRYAHYVEAGLVSTDDELQAMLRVSNLALGSEAFVEEMEHRHQQVSRTRVRREDVAFRKTNRWVPVPHLLQAICAHFNIAPSDLRGRRHFDLGRLVAAALLTRLGGLSQRDAAAYIGLTTGAAVCLQLKRLKHPGFEAAQQHIDTITQNLIFKG